MRRHGFFDMKTRVMALVMALLLMLNPFSPIVKELTAYAARQNWGDPPGPVILHTDAYCINGCFGNVSGDIYTRVEASVLGRGHH